MTPEENSALANFGQTILYNLIFSNMEETLLWGAHAAFTITALVVLWRRGLHTKLLKFLFAVMLLLLLLSSSITALDWAGDLMAIQLFLVDNSDLDLDQRLVITGDKVNALTPPGNWLVGNPGLMFLIGDLVVLIRGYVLWPRSKKFFIFPIFIFFASFVFTIVTRLLDSGVVVISNTRVMNATGLTAIVCSIATNAIVTGMIAYQALTHWQAMKASLGTRRSKSARILFYLVDAGVVFFVIQVITLGLALPDVAPYSALDYASSAFLEFSYHISITYPALVILIVASNRSLGEDSGITGLSNMESLDVGTRIEFSDPRNTQGEHISSAGGRSKASDNLWITRSVKMSQEHIEGRGVESDEGESIRSLTEKVSVGMMVSA